MFFNDKFDKIKINKKFSRLEKERKNINFEKNIEMNLLTKDSIPSTIENNPKPFQNPDSFIFTNDLIDLFSTISDVHFELILPIRVRKYLLLIKCRKYLFKHFHKVLVR